MLTRIQVGLFWFQSYLVIWMIGCWTATSATLGLWIAKHWFGVSNFELWRAGVTTFGGFVVLFLSAHLAVRVLAWHREYLSMFLARIDEVEVKVTKAENAGQPTRPEARHIGDSAVALKAPENIIKEEVQV